jgi:hypothetical protein
MSDNQKQAVEISGAEQQLAVDGSAATTSHAASSVSPLVKLAIAGMTVIIVLLAVVVVLLVSDRGPSDAAAANDPAEAAPDTFTASGELQLIGSVGGDKTDCYGEDGFDDLQTGTQVVIRDASGDTVAIGELGIGTIPQKFRMGSLTIACSWTFAVEDVPSGSTAYSVEVSHRGEVAFKESEANNLGLSLS